MVAMVTLAMVAPCRHMQIDGQLVRAYNAFGRARGNDSREQGTLQGRSDAHGSIGETKPPVAPRKSLSQILNKLGHNADVGGAKRSPTLEQLIHSADERRAEQLSRTG